MDLGAWKREDSWTVGLGIAYLLLGMLTIALDMRGLNMLLLFLPFAGFALYFLLTNFERGLSLTLFMLPISLNFLDVGMGLGLSVPGEPLIAILLVLFVLQASYRPVLDSRVLVHPLTLLVAAEWIILMITSASSTMRIVSVKYTVMRAIFLGVFFLLFSIWFRKSRSRTLFFLLFGGGLAVPVLYALLRHAAFGFSIRVSGAMPQPFFSDHTIYGAVLALIMPGMIILFRFGEDFGFNRTHRRWVKVLVAVLAIGLFFSFSRAAWLSLVIVAGLWGWLRLRLSFSWLLALICVVGVGVGLAWQPLMQSLQGTEAVSNQDDLSGHVGSIANVESDDSNLERLNRWNCAVRMFKEKPMLGFGPGTYQFQYGTFQSVREMTRISTKRGDRGGTHSEYLRALSESGIFGLLAWSCVVIGVLFYGMRLIYRLPSRKDRLLAEGVLLGLSTYFVHAFFNNFLETDKFAAPFWAMVVLLVCLDLYPSRIENTAGESRGKL